LWLRTRIIIIIIGDFSGQVRLPFLLTFVFLGGQMTQSPNPGVGGGDGTSGGAASLAPQYYDLSAPLTRPVTTLQVTGFTLREDMLPSLIGPDGSLYFGPIEEDGKYRIPSDCGIIFFHYDASVPSTFVQPTKASSNMSSSGGGNTPFFLGRGVPRDKASSAEGSVQRPVGQAAAAFTALCKRFQQGDRYGGDWEDGVFHGEGVLVTSFFTYQGGWKHGFMHGKGTIAYTRKYVDARPAAGASDSGGVGTLLLKGLSYVTPFELVPTAAAPKEYFGAFDAEHGRHGTGLMRYYNGDVYEGEWRDNCRHGKGKLRKLDGEVYDGDWVNDVRQGFGKVVYANGSLFKGLMQSDQRNGEGVMRFANGDEYFGNFVADRIEGHGTMKYRNGDVYDGAWHDQLRHGNGRFTLKRTGTTMTGVFQNGLIHGEGTVVVPGVSTFVGVFVRGERTVGTMHWHQQAQTEAEERSVTTGVDAAAAAAPAAPSPSSDIPLTASAAAAINAATTSTSSPTTAATLNKAAGVARRNYLCYQGEWLGERMHGRGLLWYTNGDFFAGRFQKNLRHGPGNMRYAAEQAEFSGQFVYGMRHGLGLLQRADGSIRAGRWQQNLFVEGYEGEWDGTAFHGVGRLTMPLDTFFGLRASNSTLKLADVSAAMNEAASPPPPPTAASAAAAEEEARNTASTSTSTSWVDGAPSAGSAATVAASDVLRRADLSPNFIDFFGLFRNGSRDGLGLLKLPALDCLVGGALSLAEERRGTGKPLVLNSNSNKGGCAGGESASKEQQKPISENGTPLPNDAVTSSFAPSACAVPSVVIKGRWVQEVLHCEKGVVAFPNGVVYIGGFRNGAREASCARVWWPDGSVMESGWRDDAPCGPGVWYQRNRMDPVFQTVIPSTLRRSRSRRTTITDTPAQPASATNAADVADTPAAKGHGTNGFVGDLLGLSYLWGLVGLGFGGGGGSDDELDSNGKGNEGSDKPRRVLIDFHNHFAVACSWYPYAMDLNTYTRVALPQIAAQTAPLANGTPWPLLMHSSSMSAAMSSPAMGVSPSSLANSSAGQPHGSAITMTTTTATASFASAPQSSTPTVRQISASAAALHLAEAPPKVKVGRANGPAVVYFDSGVVLAGEWLSNAPRLAVPFRPWSAYDSFLVWQASRPAARNCVSTFPLCVSPRTQSCYSALLSAAPDDVRGEPRRTLPGALQPLNPVVASPLAAGGSDGATTGAAAAASSSSESISGVTSPDTRCTICAKEYSFFRKRVHCTLCLRSTCSSCLGQMDTDGQRQEDVKALLQHAYVTSERVVQLAAAQAKARGSAGAAAARRVVFPSISVEQVEHAFDAKGLSTVPVCADCVRAVLWRLRYTQLWIPTSMFASVVDVEKHQRDTQMRHKASGQAAISLAARTPEVEAGKGDDAPPEEEDEEVMELSHESTRQVSTVNELLPVPQEGVDNEPTRRPTPPRQTLNLTIAAGDSPVPNPPPAPAAVGEPAGTLSNRIGSSKATNRYACSPQDLPRHSGELLPPTQYITYSGYTSHTIPHIYGELWWGRRYYYRGGFCAGERHGFGVQYMPNGERYEGAFQRDAWHGQGVYYLEDGSVLLGEFARGELRVAQYHGEVEEDTVVGVRPHGRGIGYDPDGSVYNGEWVHGQRHGTGMLHFPDGASVYSGTFVANAMEGMGKLLTTSGAYYGNFSRNQQHGKGLLFTSNCVVEGSWVHGTSSGFTRVYETDTGEVYETTYRDGNERDDCFSTPVMVEDAEAPECGQCGTAFSFFLRRHHCRLCGGVFCDACSQRRATLPANFAGDGDTGAGAEGINATIHPNTIGQRVCDACFYRLTQRRMIALRRYRDGSIYAGCWSQGRWVSRGLYCRPDGIFIVMDTHGHPLVSADLTRLKMGALNPATGSSTNESSSSGRGGSGDCTDDAGKETSKPSVPPGGLGLSNRPARTMLPISPSILQDASPTKELLDNVSVITESSSRKDLDAFLIWWATTRSRCGLQVPLDVLLVSKYQRMPAQLLPGGRNATVTIGSDAATYLACPCRCTLVTPHTPSLMPIRMFVTLADSRRAMQAMVEGEVQDGTELTRIAAAEEAPNRSDNGRDNGPSGDGGSQSVDTTSGIGEATSHVSTPAPPSAARGKEGSAPSPSSASKPSSLASSPPPPAVAAPASAWLTPEVQRTIDSDVEAAALRASRFMPVAIPRAPIAPITPATVPKTSKEAHVDDSPERPTSVLARDLERAAVAQPSGSFTMASAGGSIAVDVERGVCGLTAWATRTPPCIDDEDITDEKLIAMMRAERLQWNGTSDASSTSRVGPLIPPTPAPPPVGENTTITWEVWATHDIPRYNPLPLIPVKSDDDNNKPSAAPPSSSATPAPPTPPSQPRSEADLYFGCPFWQPTVPDAQMLLEQGKMTQAARLMRRLQREHLNSNGSVGWQNAGDGGGLANDDEMSCAWATDAAGLSSNNTNGGSPSSPAEPNGKMASSPDTLDVLQQMQVANGTGTGCSWAAGGLLSAEQRAQSGGGWAPAPMHGPFAFTISTTEKRRSADGQRWVFAVEQREVSPF
jgi:hypothetical protein